VGRFRPIKIKVCKVANILNGIKKAQIPKQLFRENSAIVVKSIMIKTLVFENSWR
jgi:hypothetical protein